MLLEIMSFLGLDIIPTTMGEFLFFFIASLFGFAFFKLFLGLLFGLPKFALGRGNKL